MEEGENGARKRSAAGVKANGVRKDVSPSPARSPVPEQICRNPSGGVPRWLILDRIVHRSSRRRHSGVITDDATTSTLANDCAGRPVRASLRIAAPPAVSRLYLHWSGRPPIDFAEPAAIAAHRSSILFRMRVPFEDPTWWGSLCSFPVDYFVYSSSGSSGSAAASSSPPSLHLLPPCFAGGRTDAETDKYFRPYSIQQQRIMLDKEMGILCHGDHGEFTVADLTQRCRREVDLCLLHHPPPPPAADAVPVQWSVRRLKIPLDMKINLSSWRNDVVVPIGGTRLCWVDYYQGMLLIDVVAAADGDSDSDNLDDQQRQQFLQFISLPSKALKKYRRPYRDAGVPDPFRCVGVTDAGIIKLVCVLTKQPPSPYPFTITTWVLDDVNRGEWRKDVDTTMGAKEFFDVCGTGQRCLPLVQPSFPMVSLVDPDVICFQLKDEDRDLYWIVAVDMRNKKLQSSALYISEEKEEGYPPKRERRNYFFGHHFIPSNFSSFLSEDATTSRDLSEKMQKTKEDRVMQKSGLEAQLD